MCTAIVPHKTTTNVYLGFFLHTSSMHGASVTVSMLRFTYSRLLLGQQVLNACQRGDGPFLLVEHQLTACQRGDVMYLLGLGIEPADRARCLLPPPPLPLPGIPAPHTQPADSAEGCTGPARLALGPARLALWCRQAGGLRWGCPARGRPCGRSGGGEARKRSSHSPSPCSGCL